MSLWKWALGAALVVACAGATGASGQTTNVVTSGLDNPRGLAFGPEGGLYVAEAGRGGPGPCIMLRGAPQCYGPAGAVSRLWRGRQERIATGLPSYGSAETSSSRGAHPPAATRANSPSLTCRSSRAATTRSCAATA